MLKIVLLRHATRASQNFGDSPLSASGHTQAVDLVGHLQPSGTLPHPTALLRSPKKRTLETLQPLSDSTQIPLTIDPRLDERSRNETSSEFDQRVRSVLEEVDSRAAKGENACLYFCSHLDWLELITILMPVEPSIQKSKNSAGVLTELEASLPWSTAEYRVFTIENGFWKMRSRGVVQVR